MPVANVTNNSTTINSYSTTIQQFFNQGNSFSQSIHEAECGFRKRLLKQTPFGSFWTPFKTPADVGLPLLPQSNKQIVLIDTSQGLTSAISRTFSSKSDEESNATFQLFYLYYANSSEPISGVIPLDISSNLTMELSRKPKIQQRQLVSTKNLHIKNIRFYSVLGIQKLDDVNGFVDIDLNVSSDWIISSQRSGKTLQAYLDENDINVSAIKDVNLSCSFIDTNTSSLSTKGCESFPSPDLSQASCSCNHATTFTIVLSVSVRTVPHEVQV